MAITTAPTYTEIIPQQTILEPLEGPKFPSNYLDRFPDTIYRKSSDSHLFKLLYALLGPNGVGDLRLQAFKNRLALEAHGVELFDLDSFYGNPFAFGRILEEIHDEDVFGVLNRDQWNEVKAKDERYRSRALDFMKGAKAGNTPLGIRFVARSGLGHEVDIVENYKYLFDVHSDDPIGLKHYGSTFSSEEFIVVPRQETPRNEVQTVTIVGTPSSGTFNLKFNGELTSTLPYDANYDEVEDALKALTGIGPNGVKVRVTEDQVYTITFIGHLANQNVPLLEALSSLTGATIEVDTLEEGVSDEDEIVYLSSEDKHNLQSALDRIRPVNTLFTAVESSGSTKELHWSNATSSSEYNEVIRYVTGQPNVNWKQDRYHWIEKDKEKEAKRVVNDNPYHYAGFHNVESIIASSQHVGAFNPVQSRLFKYYSNNDPDLVFRADRALADYTEPIAVKTVAKAFAPVDRSNQRSENVAYINGIYPVDYLFYSGVPQIKYKEEQFWASAERLETPETLLVDLGVTVAVNFIQFEISRKPIDIVIEYDALDQPDTQAFVEVTPKDSSVFPNSIAYQGDLNPWHNCNFAFDNSLKQMIYTRFIKLTFTRSAPLVPSWEDLPWSIEVKNLRIGRNVSDF